MYAWLSLKWVPKFSFKFHLQDQNNDQNNFKHHVDCYLPNAKINLRSNFNSEKLVKTETLLYGFAMKCAKRETSLCSFSKVVLKGG